MITLSQLFTDKKQAIKIIKGTIKGAGVTTIDIPYESILTYLTFESLIPLKKEYWENPTMKYDSWERNHLFMKMALHPQLYKILVVPVYIDEKDQALDAVLPMQRVTDKIIENFMMSSDQIVDERSKYAAIYTFDHRMKFDWKTGEITEVIHDGGRN